ncbi:MAG TPA: hypothetical protein VMN57_09190 [Anaerolineales bacterium]|nr:hypothetical protein [Anaerolineales bacterium]
MAALFPHGVRDEADRMVRAEGESLEAHLERLAADQSRIGLIAATIGHPLERTRRAGPFFTRIKIRPFVFRSRGPIGENGM